MRLFERGQTGTEGRIAEARGYWKDASRQNAMRFASDALAVALGILAVYAVIWAFTGKSLLTPSRYNTYVLQAQSWLKGRLDLGVNYENLEIAIYGGKYFVSFPPIPSVLLLPLVAAFGLSAPDTLVSVLAGLVGGIYALKMARLAGLDRQMSVFWALFVTVGGNFLHIGFSADVWYIAQTCAFAFTMMAFYYAMDSRVATGWAPCFLLALAFGCRPLQIVYTPLIVFLLYKKARLTGCTLGGALRRYWWWALPALAVGLALMALNWARFDNPFQFGHDFLPEFAEQKANGQFSAAYLAGNLRQLFLLPSFEEGRVRFQTFNGGAFWLYSPLFLSFAVYFLKRARASVKKPEVLLAAASIAAHFLLLCLHATLGGWQFGNRYTVDALPALYFALMALLREDRSPLLPVNVPLFLWGLSLNLAGTIALLNHWI